LQHIREEHRGTLLAAYLLRNGIEWWGQSHPWDATRSEEAKELMLLAHSPLYDSIWPNEDPRKKAFNLRIAKDLVEMHFARARERREQHDECGDRGVGAGLRGAKDEEPSGMSAVNNLSREGVERTAQEKGLLAFFPRENEVFVDLDYAPDVKLDVEVILLREGILSPQNGKLMTTSKSGANHHHVYFRTVKPMGEAERIALQALLGSDPLREALGIVHLQRGAIASVLFETPEEAKKVSDWRRLDPLFVQDEEGEEVPF
jgi:hypothetical protein